jgi:hypothetical protein
MSPSKRNINALKRLRKIRNMKLFLKYIKYRGGKAARQLNGYLSDINSLSAHGKDVRCINYRIKRDKKLFEALNLSLNGKSVLEFGPGAGDAMLIMRSMGGCVEFVDVNPFYVRYYELMGFRGFMENYYNRGSMRYGKKYHFILSHGSIDADFMNSRSKDQIKEWVRQFTSLQHPQGHIILCPTYSEGDDKTYKCKNVNSFRNSIFFKSLVDEGFEIINISEYNDPIELYPFTFYRGSLDFTNNKLIQYC